MRPGKNDSLGSSEALVRQIKKDGRRLTSPRWWLRLFLTSLPLPEELTIIHTQDTTEKDGREGYKGRQGSMKKHSVFWKTLNTFVCLYAGQSWNIRKIF